MLLPRVPADTLRKLRPDILIADLPIPTYSALAVGPRYRRGLHCHGRVFSGPFMYTHYRIHIPGTMHRYVFDFRHNCYTNSM